MNGILSQKIKMVLGLEPTEYTILKGIVFASEVGLWRMEFRLNRVLKLII